MYCPAFSKVSVGVFEPFKGFFYLSKGMPDDTYIGNERLIEGMILSGLFHV